MTTKPFDPAEYLDTNEAIEVYMAEALETGDPAFVADALSVVARAQELIDVAGCPTHGKPLVMGGLGAETLSTPVELKRDQQSD